VITIVNIISMNMALARYYYYYCYFAGGGAAAGLWQDEMPRW